MQLSVTTAYVVCISLPFADLRIVLPAHGPIDIWARSNFDDHLSHPQIPSPDLSVMYNTHNHPSPPGTATHMSSPTATPTSAEPSPFPSPVDSVLSPYFAEPATPASVSSEPARSKQSHSRKRPPGHIPRPRNAFILFRSHYVAAQLIPGKVEVRIDLRVHRNLWLTRKLLPERPPAYQQGKYVVVVSDRVLRPTADHWRDMEQTVSYRASDLGTAGGC